jgi:hypothetical protein
VAGLSTASVPSRMIFAALLGALLALRLLTPAGFMPSFEHGAVVIVTCPDAEPVAALMAHHHDQNEHRNLHQPCPYAAGSAPQALGAAVLLAAAPIVAAMQLMLGRAVAAPSTSRTHDRPPLRGPPLPA